MDDRPIGIFDSGLGGLTVVKEVKKILPYEKIVYLGDTARIPYGPRSKKTVEKFALEDANFLLKKDVKCIVIACNTASAFASSLLKKKIKVPVFEVITPVASKINHFTKNKRVGLIGTKGTVESKAYEKAILKNFPKIKVFSKACPIFVPLIEEGETKGELIQKAIKKYFSAFKDKKIDALILGCTHYPIISSQLKKELNKVYLINPGKLVAENLKLYLNDKKITSSRKDKADVLYYVTDLTKYFIETAEMFLGEKISTKLKKINLN